MIMDVAERRVKGGDCDVCSLDKKSLPYTRSWSEKSHQHATLEEQSFDMQVESTS